MSLANRLIAAFTFVATFILFTAEAAAAADPFNDITARADPAAGLAANCIIPWPFDGGPGTVPTGPGLGNPEVRRPLTQLLALR